MSTILNAFVQRGRCDHSSTSPSSWSQIVSVIFDHFSYRWIDGNYTFRKCCEMCSWGIECVRMRSTIGTTSTTTSSKASIATKLQLELNWITPIRRCVRRGCSVSAHDKMFLISISHCEILTKIRLNAPYNAVQLHILTISPRPRHRWMDIRFHSTFILCWAWACMWMRCEKAAESSAVAARSSQHRRLGALGSNK